MLYITVKLYGKTGMRGEFREYESKALKIFRQHGGEVIVAYVPSRDSESVDIPDEIQILKIENQTKFEAFMHDPDRAKMSAERESVIKRTEVYISKEIIDYSKMN